LPAFLAAENSAQIDFSIVRLDGIGPVRIGMSLSELNKALAHPGQLGGGLMVMYEIKLVPFTPVSHKQKRLLRSRSLPGDDVFYLLAIFGDVPPAIACS
jgi:hypothetical protein